MQSEGVILCFLFLCFEWFFVMTCCDSELWEAVAVDAWDGVCSITQWHTKGWHTSELLMGSSIFNTVGSAGVEWYVWRQRLAKWLLCVKAETGKMAVMCEGRDWQNGRYVWRQRLAKWPLCVKAEIDKMAVSCTWRLYPAISFYWVREAAKIFVQDWR